MKNLKKEKKDLINKIISIGKKKGILPFLLDELEYNIRYLNIYKVRNIYDNLNILWEEINVIQNYYLENLE